MGVKRDGGLLLNFSSTKKEGLFERGGLNTGFKMLLLFFFLNVVYIMFSWFNYVTDKSLLAG